MTYVKGFDVVLHLKVNLTLYSVCNVMHLYLGINLPTFASSPKVTYRYDRPFFPSPPAYVTREINRIFFSVE